MAGLAVPQVVINGIPIGIKPNSFSYKEGFGDRTVRTKSTGGGATELVITTDVSTKRGMVKFTVYTEDTSVELIRQWLVNVNANIIQSADTGFVRSFTNAVIKTDPEIALGADGEVALEWETDTAV